MSNIERHSNQCVSILNPWNLQSCIWNIPARPTLHDSVFLVRYSVFFRFILAVSILFASLIRKAGVIGELTTNSVKNNCALKSEEKLSTNIEQGTPNIEHRMALESRRAYLKRLELANLHPELDRRDRHFMIRCSLFVIRCSSGLS